MKALLTVFLTTTGFAMAEQVIPSAWDKERYEKTVEQSPFALATPVTTAAPIDEGPLKNLVITSMAKLDDGRDMVFLIDVGGDRSMAFVGNEPHQQSGISIKEVKWGSRWEDCRVVARLGSETKEIMPKEKPAPAVAPAAGPATGGGNRGPGPNPAAAIPPAPIVPAGLNSKPNTLKPGGNSGIPRPTTSQMNVPRPAGMGTNLAAPNGSQQFQPRNGTRTPPTPGQGRGNFSPNSGDQRSRVRTINNNERR